MAAIGSTFPSNNHSATGADSNTSQQNNSVATDPLANQSTFLKLLVSQLKNQNPASPMDGTTFVTQLAQFSSLEQSLAMRQDLDSMSLKYAGSSSTTPGTATSSDSGSGKETSGSSGVTGNQS